MEIPSEKRRKRRGKREVGNSGGNRNGVSLELLGKGSKMDIGHWTLDKDMEKQNMKAIKNEKRSKFKTRKKEGTNPKSGNLHWNMDVIHIFIKCQYD